MMPSLPCRIPRLTAAVRRIAALLGAALVIAGCAATTGGGAPTAPVLIFGEQHDQPDQQRQAAAEIAALASRGELAAVVLEMADAGRSTRGLPLDATPAQAREALGWAGWPWDAYEGIVMTAVRAGVPVLGGNLPRPRMRSVMGDAGWDSRIGDAPRERLVEAVRTGHCNLLPASQEPGMVRIQIARDASMARTVADALQAAPAGARVVLHTGAQHASRDRGVPLHLPPGTASWVVMFGDAADGLVADERRPAAVVPTGDPCKGLEERLRRPQAPAG
ncbi:MAG: ChaN family lipoprotein [Rubrivivax sp.]|jgi:uncharacterized iron-regulated protein|nr:ChaN family lipoprotein [Rubrivivax sp.]